MRVAVLQSNYIPWKGYFDLVRDVDLFVFYDDVQYTKGDWRNRNLIKTARGTRWLSIPVGSNTDRRICDVALPGGGWRAEHWRHLTASYGATPFFADYALALHAVYDTAPPTLSGLNQALITTIAREYLGITTAFRDSREFPVAGRKQERLLALLQATGATSYVSGPSAHAYIDPDAFRHRGIELLWKDYSGYPEYPQPFPPFVHEVSILDVLFNTGPEAAHYTWGWRRA